MSKLKYKYNYKVLRFILFISIPIITVLVLLGLPIDTKLGETDVIGKVIYLPDKITKPSLLTAFSDALQIPLYIQNFEIYFKNSSKYNGKNPYYDSDTEDSEDCNKPSSTILKIQGKINNHDFNIKINAGEKSDTFTYRRGESIEINQNFIMSGLGNCIFDNGQEIYIRKNIYEWFGKALFIMIFWILFLPALLDVSNFLKRK